MALSLFHGCASFLDYRHERHRRGALFDHQRRLCFCHPRPFSGPLFAASPANPARNPMEPRQRAHLCRARRRGRMGLATSWLDADLYRPPRHAALVSADQPHRLSRYPRHMVLLDPPLDARAQAVQNLPRRPSRKPPPHRVGGDELSLDRGPDGRFRHPRLGVPNPHSHLDARPRPHHHDGDGCRQSYGLGNVSALARSWSSRALADNSNAPPKTPQRISRKLWSLFSILG
jgi:hypothetical protein